jgi:hypothetical protein
MFFKKIFLVAAFSSSLIANAQLKWPAVTKTTKPWTRWWWEGSAVTAPDLTWNLQQYQQAGLGGVEITPIYGIYGYEKQFVNFLSPQWMKLFQHTLTESKRLNIGVDLANATGWPFGGPWVTDDDASKSIYYKTYTVAGGSSLSEAIVYNQEAWVRTANNKPAGIDSILAPVSANKNLQALALDQIQYPGKLPLQSLMAYSDNKTVLDLTGKVTADGKLNWTAPAGNWTLYALFEGLHGKMVERGAPGGEGYAIDHFSKTAANNYFKKFDQAFKGYDLSYLRSFFNDSYEVDDARGQANWTPTFLAEFKKRRGYDLREQLPALFGKDNEDKNSRVIYDYRSVIDELLLENFTEQWKKWAVSKGKMVRNQSHGSPANTLDLYSVVDIPETEGTDILRFKFATSAANVTGKKLVSSESATWLNEHFLSSLGDVKKAIDLYFLGGVNHIFYHGTAYSPKDAPWPGWLFYAAVHFQPNNPQWKDFHALNEYITRVQSFLQQGKPDNDVLLYYPIVDRYSEPGNALLQHFDGMERNFEKTHFEEVSKEMLAKGYSYDFFSDRQLQNFTFSNSKIISGGNSYKIILVPGVKLIPLQSMKKLVALAKQGAKIIFYEALPADIPGLGNLDNQRKEFNALKEQIKFAANESNATHKEENVFQNAMLGKGTVYSGTQLEILLMAADVYRETVIDKGFSFIRRKNINGYTYFITNRTDKAITDWATLHTGAVDAAIFNPATGENGFANIQPEEHVVSVMDQTGKEVKSVDKQTQIYLQLQPGESCIVQTFNSPVKAKPYTYYQASGQTTEITGDWTIEFLNGGPVIPQKVEKAKLGSWTELEGDAVKNFSGTAKYSISFAKPTGNAVAYTLFLGSVHETAEVILNGKSIATLVGPSFQVNIPASALKETNKLEIIVANLMANRISYMDKNNLPWKIFYNTNMPARRRENSKNGIFDASSWKPLPSGLPGPVTLTPVSVIRGN